MIWIGIMIGFAIPCIIVTVLDWLDYRHKNKLWKL